ncbi:hypothetical protein KP509_26G021300 [Ceratopteris richardii]|uniref:Pentatricopeptide repeat-containing protein n=1 Tax=Ceratopteris richardii TaxID=49495 RepID=A0A8T2RJ03_CERRI|nr:hypothetical protein KP509_26G021300 [Ceratopteris richardii]
MVGVGENGGSFVDGYVKKSQRAQETLCLFLVLGHWCNNLIPCFAACGALSQAFQVLSKLRDPNVFECEAMAHSRHGLYENTLNLYDTFLKSGIQPDGHIFILESGIAFQSFLLNGILNMYLNCNSINDAFNVFNSSLQKDTVTWNIMLEGSKQHVKCSRLDGALELFNAKEKDGDVVIWRVMPNGYACCGSLSHSYALFCQMQQQEGLEIGKRAYASMLHACSCAEALEYGKIIHMYIDMYARCGSLFDAQCAFNTCFFVDKMTWNALIASYASNGYLQEAFEFLQAMEKMGCKLVHHLVLEFDCDFNFFLFNSLINMHIKCRSLDNAETFLKLTLHSSKVTWSLIVSGHIESGCSEKALLLFQRMLCAGIMPDNSSKAVLNTMTQSHGIPPTFEPVNCIIDLLGRTGFLLKAADLLYNLLYIHNHVGWMSLLSHCKLHESKDLENHCINHIVEDQNWNASGYLLMDQVLIHSRDEREADNFKELRTGVNAWKLLGVAFIEINDRFFSFHVQHVDKSPCCETDDKLVRLNGYLLCI